MKNKFNTNIGIFTKEEINDPTYGNTITIEYLTGKYPANIFNVLLSKHFPQQIHNLGNIVTFTVDTSIESESILTDFYEFIENTAEYCHNHPIANLNFSKTN